jgi:acyl-CoA synthetase (AMP-forming)/AMP-acid ligase II
VQYNIADLFESVVDAVPDRIGLVCGERRLTYAELDERANRLAHFLASQGVGPGDQIGLYLQNGTEYVEAMLAAFKLRAVPVNINFRYVAEELRYLCRDSRVKGLLFNRGAAARVAEAVAGLPDLAFFVVVEDGTGAEAELVNLHEFEAAARGFPTKRDFAPRSEDDLYVIYTGGTTGMPKGVMWRHEDAFHACLMAGNPMGPPPARPEEVAERAKAKGSIAMMTAAPLIHGAAQLGTLIAMMQGGKAVLAPRFEPHLIWETIAREKVLSLSLVGDAMARPLAEALAEDPSRYDTSSLFVIGSAGAIFSQGVKDQLKALLPNVTLLDNYGASEVGSQGLDAGGVVKEGGIRFKMIANSAILDDALRPIEPGSGHTGRVALRGHIPLGYWGDPEKTAKTFFTVDGVRWVIPGDLGRPEADGTVTVFGRGSICINSGGEKIFPEEVEGALKQHPDIFDAVVVGVPDARWGERVTALVQPRSGAAPPSLANLVAHCKTLIASYKVPRALHVVSEMKRSPAGKADYPWAKALAIESEKIEKSEEEGA